MTASPLSTGGAGPVFENDVGTHYLAALLTGSAARGTRIGTVVRVGLQRAASGAPLDDVIVETDGAGGTTRLDLQVKRRMTFAASDREFPSVIGACWETLARPDFASGPGNRIGVEIAQFPEKVKAHYTRVPVWALSSADAVARSRRLWC